LILDLGFWIESKIGNLKSKMGKGFEGSRKNER